MLSVWGQRVNKIWGAAEDHASGFRLSAVNKAGEEMAIRLWWSIENVVSQYFRVKILA